jgi:hypothetical protein
MLNNVGKKSVIFFSSNPVLPAVHFAHLTNNAI